MTGSPPALQAREITLLPIEVNSYICTRDQELSAAVQQPCGRGLLRDAGLRVL